MQFIHVVLLVFSISAVTNIIAQDVQYAVVAFLPAGAQSMGVSIDGGNPHPLSASQETPQLYTGTAPSPSQHYQYTILNDQGQAIATEANQRAWVSGATSTGNEFFNRSRTTYEVPSLPQAYHPIYPPTFTNMNQSNEVATVLLEANATAVQEILGDPKGDHEYARVDRMTYISNKEIFTFTGAGFRNSGQSSKEFTRQSFKVKLNEYKAQGEENQLLYGRTTIKLRSEPADPTMMREKLALDMLGAAGAVTLSSQWIRLYVNGQPFGLFLMTDEATTHFIESAIYAGDHDRTNTGPTYKMNSLNATQQGNLVYQGDDVALYPEWLYELEDEGSHEFPNKSDELVPLVQLMRQLNDTNTDIQSLVDVPHTMLHLAINMLTGAWDGMWYQASNYFMHNQEENRWIVISYDYDEVMGLSSPEYHYMMTTPWQNFTPPGRPRPLIEPILEDEQAFNNVLTTLVKRFFKPSTLNPRIDAWREMLKEDMAWNLELPHHTSNATINTTWTLWNYENNVDHQDGQVLGLKQWIQERSSAICQQLSITDEDDLPPLGPYQQPEGQPQQGSSSSQLPVPFGFLHVLLAVLLVLLLV